MKQQEYPINKWNTYNNLCIVRLLFSIFIILTLLNDSKIDNVCTMIHHVEFVKKILFLMISYINFEIIHVV